MAVPQRGPALAFSLLRAADWFDDALRAYLESSGWPSLTRTQSLVLATLEGESARPAELARRCGVTRQTMQQAVAGLTASDVVAVGPEPTDSRGRRVTLAPRGHDLLEDARNHLERLERLLEERLGRDTVDVLREALTQEWGDPKLTEDAPAAQPNTSVALTIV